MPTEKEDEEVVVAAKEEQDRAVRFGMLLCNT
jgi:hypothetical protein